MIRRLLCALGWHARVLRHDFDGTFTTVCRRCEPLRYKLLTELMEQRPPFGITRVAWLNFDDGSSHHLALTDSIIESRVFIDGNEIPELSTKFAADVLERARAAGAARNAR